MKVTELIKLDFSNFPNDEQYAQIPGKLFLADNLDGHSVHHHEASSRSYPLQTSVVMVFEVIEGEITTQINLKEYKVSKGQNLIILPGSIIEKFNFTEDLICIFIAEAPDFSSIDIKLKMMIEVGENTRNNPVRSYNPELIAENIRIYKALKAKLLSKDFSFKAEVAQNYLNLMRYNILDNHIKENGGSMFNKPSSRKEEIFHSFIECVKKNYMKERSVSFYADKLCVSPKYLSTLIKEVSGRFATEWITDFVILEAKALLRAEGTSVKYICDRLNFPNPSFFAKYFRKNTGYSPREFKQL